MAIRDGRPSLAMMGMRRHRFHHSPHLTSWYTSKAYFVLSPNNEEFLNKFLSPDPDPDPDHLRRGPSHEHNTSCVKKIKSIRAIVFEIRVRTERQTQMHYARTPLREQG